MTGYDILREAAAAQRQGTPGSKSGKAAGAQLDLRLDAGDSHPGVTCAVHAMEDHADTTPGDPRSGTPNSVDPADTADCTRVVAEPLQGRPSLDGTRPFWAHAADSVKEREPSRALVPVIIDGQTGHVEDEFHAGRAFGGGGGGAGGGPFSFGFRFDVSRPRMLLAVLALLVVGVVANNISSRFQAKGIGDAHAQQEQVASLTDSLKLLEPGKVAAGTAPPSPAAQVAAREALAAPVVTQNLDPPAAVALAPSDPRRAPANINDYVRWALPQVNPNAAARSGLPPGPVADASDRRLPRVEPTGREKASPGHPKPAALPPKRPVPDRIDWAAPVAPAASAERSAPTPRLAAPSGPIDLNTVYIEASLTREEMPYRVQRIAEQEGGRGAYIVPREQKGTDGTGVWAQAGTSFPNGWELVGVEGSEAIFLQKDGRSVRVPVSQ